MDMGGGIMDMGRHYGYGEGMHYGAPFIMYNGHCLYIIVPSAIIHIASPWGLLYLYISFAL